jgi:peptide deformylase
MLMSEIRPQAATPRLAQSHGIAHPQIIQGHDARLRQKSRPIAADECWFARQAWHSMESVLQNVRAAHHFRHSMGLAAIQIGIPLQLIVIWTPQLGFLPMANPEIISTGQAASIEFEASLSFFEQRGRVTRPYTIRLRYWNERMEAVEQEFHGWAARIIQHEVDHLHGILYTDRMDAGENLISHEDYLILKAAC